MYEGIIICKSCGCELDTLDGESIPHICFKCGNDIWETFDIDTFTVLKSWQYKINFLEKDNKHE